MTDMNFYLCKTTASAIPTLGKGAEYVPLLLPQVSKHREQPIVTLPFSVPSMHVNGAKCCSAPIL